MTLDAEALREGDPDREALIRLMGELEFFSLAQKLGDAGDATPRPPAEAPATEGPVSDASGVDRAAKRLVIPPPNRCRGRPSTC